MQSANGFMDVVRGQRFTILVGSFTNKKQQLPMHELEAWSDLAFHHYIPLDVPLSANVPEEDISALKNELRLYKRRSAFMESHIVQ